MLMLLSVIRLSMVLSIWLSLVSVLSIVSLILNVLPLRLWMLPRKIMLILILVLLTSLVELGRISFPVLVLRLLVLLVSFILGIVNLEICKFVPAFYPPEGWNTSSKEAPGGGPIHPLVMNGAN